MYSVFRIVYFNIIIFSAIQINGFPLRSLSGKATFLKEFLRPQIHCKRIRTDALQP